MKTRTDYREVLLRQHRSASEPQEHKPLSLLEYRNKLAREDWLHRLAEFKRRSA